MQFQVIPSLPVSLEQTKTSGIHLGFPVVNSEDKNLNLVLIRD